MASTVAGRPTPTSRPSPEPVHQNNVRRPWTTPCSRSPADGLGRQGRRRSPIDSKPLGWSACADPEVLWSPSEIGAFRPWQADPFVLVVLHRIVGADVFRPHRHQTAVGD